MGWTGYSVSTPVRRKYECDKYNTWDEENSSCEVLKSAQIGKVWYGACRHTDKKTGNVKVFGSVCLTNVDNSDSCNFWIKEMDESMHPFYYDCPIEILNLLTPTENKEALEWRKICRETVTKRKEKIRKLNALPVGSVIQTYINRWDSEKYAFVNEQKRIIKEDPAYQFKRPWWRIEGTMTYIKKNNIPDDFKVIERPSK